MNSGKVDLKGLTLEQLQDFLVELGTQKFRAKQIMKWIYQREVTDFEQMTDQGKALRQQLAERAYISQWQPEVVEASSDGTKKYLFRLEDGESVEAVRIPMDTEKDTLCISTQVGCAMQCQFCLTGTFGLTRNLTPAEIVNQVCGVLHDGPIANIVLMGMGEPLHNLDNVVTALKILYLDDGLGYGSRRVTLSTSGLIPQMRELWEQVKVNLAVSLNATTDEVRDVLMPINKKYPLKELMAACRDYPLGPRQKITFEYILIKGVNDSLADAKRLVKLLHGIRAKINLIPFNEHEGSEFKCPDEETITAFQSYLMQRQIITMRRASKGQDISAACGQLKGKLDKEAEA
ncbi:23S rRNA m(2)A-2503 methyltransferase [Malonomonas rubra DSM 5091]|uniref:Probable dual-specificity RNA methyltransferase RlmN n=1 Tax=Malonomonas rubra DSM 5091 TaxID=1122189 RepID=A0A1M6DKH0_MALRU|nr:23S rRNA (adenine(2503)-C(2))-methyltransferase RlmN [Malonomonas rubra]SHI73670.1 23S rRNA m(2)A-2503 methyltransferase [Malonomonas rubra DSM 5091]